VETERHVETPGAPTSRGEGGIELRVFAALAVVQLMFGSLSVALKATFHYLPPPAIIMVRVGGGAVILQGLVSLTGRERIRSRRDFLAIAGLALCGVVFNQTLFAIGVHHTSAIIGTVLNCTAMPIFAMILAVSLGRERLGLLRALGVGVAAAGALVIFTADLATAGADSALGDGLVLLNAFSFALFLVLGRGVLQRYGSLTLTAWTFTFGNLVMIPWGLVSLHAQPAAPFTPKLAALLAFLVLGPTVIAYQLNAFALKRAPASLVAAFVYAQPMVAAALAILLQGEHLTKRQIIGAVIVLAGLHLATRRPLGQREKRANTRT
jgi:drug/metabolite transporter (DMT)-like permease